MRIRLFKIATFNEDNRKVHSNKHYKEYINDIRFRGIKFPSEQFENLYESISKQLSCTRVDISDSTSRYVGYVALDDRQIKYDRQTWDYLVISDTGIIISLHKKHPKEYQRVLKKEYKSEFDYNT